MKIIPFFDLNKQTKALKQEILEAISEVCDQSAFSSGPFAERFENQFAAYLNTPHFASVSSGSDALFLALRSLGVKQGDEVIVPTATFIATAYAVQRLGAIPVFADCDPVTWQISPESIRTSITDKTVGIIGVHLYGQMFPVDEVLKIANEHKLFLIEDCAQSQGSLFNGKAAGTFGDAGCFSFYPAKNLGAFGEGGGISSRDPALIDKVKLLRAQGSHIRYHHEDIGYNMRMDGIQAAVLSVKLKYLNEWNQKRALIMKKYRTAIHNKLITFQGELPNTEPAWYLAVVCTDDRDHFLAHMNEADIHCGIHYPVPCHLQPAMGACGYREGDLPNAEYLANRCVSLPLYPELDDSSVERVIDAVNSYKRA